MTGGRVIGFVLAAAFSALAAERQPAAVRMYSLSLRFESASTTLAGETFSVELTSDESFAEINGEVAPLYLDNFPTHGAYFRLRAPTSPAPITGQIAFDEANPVDTNGNGFQDFYEVSLPVSDISHGLFATAVTRGSVKATWSRAAGSATGTCRLQLTSADFGQLPEFVHKFEIIEYTGTLVASPGTSTITASLALKQTGNETNTLSGALAFTRAATNRFDQLLILPGSVLTSAGNVLLHNGGYVNRDVQSKTNYFGFLELADGDPATRIEDYYDWVVSIDDPNDSNSNGIPDLSDDISVPTAPAVSLGISISSSQVVLNVRGEIGKVYGIEQTASLSPPQWTQTTSMTLTNTPQLLQLPIPGGQTLFWRMRGPPKN